MQVIPLEMLPAGEFDLVYRSPLDPRSGELPVLPLSITGALAMAKPEDPAAAADGYVAADQVGRDTARAPCITCEHFSSTVSCSNHESDPSCSRSTWYRAKLPLLPRSGLSSSTTSRRPAWLAWHLTRGCLAFLVRPSPSARFGIV